MPDPVPGSDARRKWAAGRSGDGHDILHIWTTLFLDIFALIFFFFIVQLCELDFR